MKVAVVTAALNEVESIDSLLTALASQTRVPNIVVVADGGSTDGTLERISARAVALPFHIRVLRVPGKIARARNAAICEVDCEIIAVTDADCVPVTEWIEEITAPIVSGVAAAVAGAYRATARTTIERAISTFTWVPTSGKSGRFLPSHRSVSFLRSVWQQIGGYNEQIDSGEDTAFDLQVERQFPYAVAPRALVAWRPRSSVKKALWQQVFYGAGDGQARIQTSYHTIVALFVLAEFGTMFGGAATRALSATAVGVVVGYFIVKHLRLFKQMIPDILWVILLTLFLPPARLAGFAIGLCGGSVRGILKRS